MDIRIKTTAFEMNSQTSSYLGERIASFEKLLSHESQTARCEVEIGRDAGGQRHGDNMWFAEVSIIVPGRERIYARNNAQSVNTAIDDVKREVDRQLRKQKGSYLHRLRRSGARLKEWMRGSQ
ncbi:HPF/RaiA family ribosome-associated protein [Candidatus Kaiserbacteria bacterium]|nr:HPF/RaiA family ribosome-associated protein [Candidatus Kaiserbacteria bacterium]